MAHAKTCARPVAVRTALCKGVYARRESVADALRPDARAFTAVSAVIVAVCVVVERIAKPIPHANQGARRVSGRKRVDGVGAHEKYSCDQHHGGASTVSRGHRERRHLSLPHDGSGGLGTATTFQRRLFLVPGTCAVPRHHDIQSKHTHKKKKKKKNRL